MCVTVSLLSVLCSTLSVGTNYTLNSIFQARLMKSEHIYIYIYIHRNTTVVVPIKQDIWFILGEGLFILN